jgi:DNA-binding transcriptional LysR family regulator
VQIETFQVMLAIARYGSITRAAQTLGYTQSAVSRQIAALEADVGAQLFDRLPRGVALTEEGRCLLPHAEAVVNRMAAASRDLDELRGMNTGRLRVGAFPTAVAAVVPRALAAFREAHPQVILSLVEGRTTELVAQVVAGDVDVAVVSAPPDRPIDAPGLDLRHLLDERLVVAVPRGHRLARRRTVRLAELAEDFFIVGSATAEDALLRASLPPGFQPKVDIVVADWTGKIGCVVAGLGVALMPALAARAAPADVALLRLHNDDASVRQIFAATAAARRRRTADQFVPFLATAAALA